MMKRKLLITPLMLLCSFSFAADVSKNSPKQAQFSYSYGYLMGQNYAEVLADVNLDTFMQGLKQGAAGKKPSLTAEEMAKALTQYKKTSQQQQLTQFNDLAQTNLEQGTTFLAENAKKPNVFSTKSGLQYEIISPGSGKKPKPSAKVLVNYEGRLLDGTVFDSSIAREQPVEFQVSQVIPAWTEALQIMSEGAKYRLYVPAKLAYGEMGSGDAIEPNSTLIFDLELLKILP